MEAIFGVFCLKENDLSHSLLEMMQAFVASERLGDCQLWKSGGIALGRLCVSALYTNHPVQSLHAEVLNKPTFSAIGRLDNFSELCSLLNIPEPNRFDLTDHEVMSRAYDTWGRESASRMFGDWAFVAWHSAERQLVLSRSHYGSQPLYYHIDQNILAFASSRQLLLALQLCPLELDELWLAQYLISWPVYLGERTSHKPINCIPPAHTLVVTEKKCKIHCYWHPEEASVLTLSRRDDYVDGFRAVFDEAVNCRLRSDGPVAVTLSGGLDSSAVAATAAELLSAQGKRLTAYTSVPLYNSGRYEGQRFGDELPFARATAEYAGNIDLHSLSSSEISPLVCIRRVLQCGGIPVHGAGNLYWMMDIQQAAKAAGCDVVLTGAAGNAGISWEGDLFSQHWSFLLTHIAQRKLIQIFLQRTKQRIKAAMPINLIAARQWGRMDQQNWCRSSAINPVLARRLRLLEQRLHDPDERPTRNPREQRSRILMLARSVPGTYISENGSWPGLGKRDPKAGARVSGLCIFRA